MSRFETEHVLKPGTVLKILENDVENQRMVAEQ